MTNPTEMEEKLVFSYVYYKIKDYDRVVSFFKDLKRRGLFNIDSQDIQSQELNGTFVMAYPKNHWNPFSMLLGAKQVLGGAEIKDGILKCDTKTKSGLAKLRSLIETTPGVKDAIEFEKEEYEDIMERLKKKK